MTERRERCPSRPTGTCSMDERLECDYCFIRDIEDVNDLHAAIQQDDGAAILQGRQQSRSSQIDSNSAIMAERRQRCLSIPPGYCTGTSRDGCDYCRMRDIIATRNIQHAGADMSPAELQATIQQDVSAARLQSSFRILVTRALLAKFSEWNSSKPRLMRTFRLVRRV